MKENYDVIVVGAGPAGIMTCYELYLKNPELEVLLIDKGHDVMNRHCPIKDKKIKQCPVHKDREPGCIPACSITDGFGGAGAYSDGKFNITSEFGGWLTDYLSNDEVEDVIHYVDNLYLKHGATKEITDPTTDKVKEIEHRGYAVGLKLLRAKVRHLGTEENLRIMTEMSNELKQHMDLQFKTSVQDILVEDHHATGIVLENGQTIHAKKVVLATGGIGGLYKHSTNYPHLTGDGIELSKKYQIELKNLDYVQIHPTTLYTTDHERSFLISESVRGEGAILLDKNGNRFVNELLPRDVVAEAIFKQMEKDQTDYVYEDLRPIGKEEIASHFPHIVEHCKEKGYDVFKEPIPVVPAQHYFMGGIKVDYDSHTSMKHLYAIGETACNGVHGKNRLASNSLLESLVFAKRAAKRIEKSLKERNHYMFDQTTLKLNVDPLIISALKEDITSEDVSTNSVMPFSKTGVVDLICKEDGIICGLQIFERTFELLDEACDVEFFASDGDHVEKGQLLGRVKGDVRVLLSGERVALNYLQRMSGIATYTANVQEYLKDSSIRLLDTRKTTPNNRIFEKYAVRVGGGHNHRYNLSDGVLLKDNHIGAAGGVKEAIMLAKEYAPFVRKIEIEVENMEMVKEAVEAGADIIMLDNMDDDMLKEAIAYIDHRAEIEVSGNVTKENIARLTNLGVDYVSSGALTHSAPILDLSLKNLHVL